jgi:hypothetical protein
MDKKRITGLALAVVGTCALAACSAGDYSAPIATFAAATTAADTALADLNKSATGAYSALLVRRAQTNTSMAVRAADGECELGSTRCRIALVDTAGRATFLSPDPLLDNMVAVMGDINAYARNLAALAADDSAQKAATDVNAALGSVQNLANTVANLDKQGGTVVPEFATPVGAAVNWAIGQYAEQVKLRGLRTATEKADPIIQRAAKWFENAAVFASDSQRAVMTASVREKIDAYQDDRRNASNLNAANDAAKAYDEYLRSKPGETFRKMAVAHASLTAALNNPEFSWAQAIADIQNFAAQAKQLAKIVQDLIALAEKK